MDDNKNKEKTAYHKAYYETHKEEILPKVKAYGEAKAKELGFESYA